MKYQPNIVLMISHDSGRMFSNYGYKINTPNFDKMAAQSLQFDNYFCPAPQCSPSRGSIMTGKYPHNNGLIGLAHLGFCIKSGTVTLPQALSNGGYETTLIGLSHETINEAPAIEKRQFTSGTELGYQTYIPVAGDRAPDVASETIHYLETRESNQPFYLNVGFFETHRDFDEYTREADNPEEVEVFNFLKDTRETKEDVSLFNGSVKVLDTAVGKIFDYIKASSYSENTIVIYTTDHGIAFPKAKGTLKDAGLGTALLISLPNGLQNGIHKTALLCNVDLMPTILELAGLEIPKDLDGRSFAKDILNSKDEGREEFFTEMTWHDKYQPMRGLRTAKYSYVHNFTDGPKTYMTVDSHLSLSGKVMRDECYVPNEPEEFYDLSLDPLEDNNLIDDPSYRQIIEEMRDKVDKWMIETNDPILKGAIAGRESSRWAKEAELGHTYPGREAYYVLHKKKLKK